MNICEIFTSIQGESTHAGLPCTFVRLTGCNLRCSYCDTSYAYEGGKEMTPEDIVEEVVSAGQSLVEITGGEPLLQAAETAELAGRLLDLGYRVLIETNGSLPIGDIDRRATIVLDIKTPSSGMADRMDFGNIWHLKETDEVKFVIADRNDYEWAKGIVNQYGLADTCTVLFGTVFGRIEARQLGSWIMEDRLPVRLNVQLHKLIYGPDERGV